MPLLSTSSTPARSLVRIADPRIAFYAGGLMPGSQNVAMYYFVIANGFLKLYIVALYMSQSFYGLNGGTHRSVLTFQALYIKLLCPYDCRTDMFPQ